MMDIAVKIGITLGILGIGGLLIVAAWCVAYELWCGRHEEE